MLRHFYAEVPFCFYSKASLLEKLKPSNQRLRIWKESASLSKINSQMLMQKII